MKHKFVLLSLGVVSLLFVLTACDQSDKKVEALDPIVKPKMVEAIIDHFDSADKNTHWKGYEGEWVFKQGELLQTSTKNDFPVILNESQAFSDLDVSVNFKPISGSIDASGGLIFRAEDEDNYYIVRANALENNFRLYTFTDGLRHQLASASVTPPAFNQFHTIRVIAVGDHIQAYLNGKLEIDFQDKTFRQGYTGVWTKADSVTAFDDFKVRQLSKTAN